MKAGKIVLLLFIGMIAAPLFAFISKSNGWTGTWEYTVKGVPAEYENGVIKFAEKDGAITGETITNNETFPMENLKIKNDTVAYDFDIESTTISVELIRLKDSISGKVITPDDTFFLKGYRKKE